RLNRNSRGRLGQVKYSCQRKLCETAASTAMVTAAAVPRPAHRTSTESVVVCRTNPMTPTRLNRTHRTPVTAITWECAGCDETGSRATEAFGPPEGGPYVRLSIWGAVV